VKLSSGKPSFLICPLHCRDRESRPLCHVEHLLCVSKWPGYIRLSWARVPDSFQLLCGHDKSTANRIIDAPQQQLPITVPSAELKPVWMPWKDNFLVENEIYRRPEAIGTMARRLDDAALPDSLDN